MKFQKNGFTIIEVMGVIILLSIIGLITIPIITGTMKSSREKLYETQIDNLKSAARLYVVDPLENDKKNIKKLENGEIESFDISLDNLKKQGKIDKNFENPKTGEPFKGCIYVKVTTNENGIFEYTVVDNCN